MGANSKIEWTNATWTPIRARHKKTRKVGWHCEPVTPGCNICYAGAFNERLGTRLPFKPGHRKDIELFLDEEMLMQPLHWKNPRMIFVCSMTDLFADFVPDEWIDKIFAVMALCPQHTFQVLTKRSKRMREYVARMSDRWFYIERAAADWHYKPQEHDGFDWLAHKHFLPNVWLGVSAEDQERADERIPDLLQTPAAVRFVSAEPLLRPWYPESTPNPTCPDGLLNCLYAPTQSFAGVAAAKVDWIIVGGESGRRARPMHPDWVRSIRDQCQAAGTAFFLKQWGEWAPGECADFAPTRSEHVAWWWNDSWQHDCITPKQSEEMHRDDAPDLYRIGKRRAGRLLDGVEHNAMPEMRT